MENNLLVFLDLLIKYDGRYEVDYRAFATKGAEVILASRSTEKGEKTKGGEYFGPDGKREIKGYPVVVPSNEESHNLSDVATYRGESGKLTGGKFKLKNLSLN